MTGRRQLLSGAEQSTRQRGGPTEGGGETFDADHVHADPDDGPTSGRLRRNHPAIVSSGYE